MNITKTVIYYYFRNKAEIFSHCHSQAVDAMEASMAQASKSGNPVDHIRDFIRIYIQELIGINNPGAVLLDDDLLPPEEGDNIRERKQAMLKKLEALIASGIEKGDIRPCNPKAATMALMSAINILPRWYNENGPLSPEILAESYSNIFISGLAAR